MKIILLSAIQLGDHQEDLREISKTYESNIIPHKGDYITDSVVKDSNEFIVDEVTLSYQEDECYVVLSPIWLDTKEEFAKSIEKAKQYGWAVK